MKLALTLFTAVALHAADGSFLLRGGTIHPVTSGNIENGSVLVIDGRIEAVGVKMAVPKGVRVIDIKGLHVYPGMIDAATTLGLTEIGAVTETNDVNELGSFKPQLRAMTAVNPASEHIPVTRANGITTVLVQPGGGVIPGQAAIMHLDGWTTAGMTMRDSAAMRIDYPFIAPPSRFMQRAATRTPYAELKRRQEQQVRDLEDILENARRYQQAKAAGGPGFSPDLKLEALLPVIEGKLPVLIRADREKTIREAIAFAGKQKLRMILHSGRDAWKVADLLKEKNIPVILGPTQEMPGEEDDAYDQVFSAPGILAKAGVKFAIATFSPTDSINPRSLPYQASSAVPFGLPMAEALKAVTINPAEILGVANDIGSIEKGKLADLMITDGDPLEVRTQVKQVFIAGKAVDLENKHHRLYERYLNRP